MSCDKMTWTARERIQLQPQRALYSTSLPNSHYNKSFSSIYHKLRITDQQSNYIPTSLYQSHARPCFFLFGGDRTSNSLFRYSARSPSRDRYTDDRYGDDIRDSNDFDDDLYFDDYEPDRHKSTYDPWDYNRDRSFSNRSDYKPGRRRGACEPYDDRPGRSSPVPSYGRSRGEYFEQAYPGESDAGHHRPRYREDSHGRHHDEGSGDHYRIEERGPSSRSRYGEDSHRRHWNERPGFGRIEELRSSNLRHKTEARALLQEVTSLVGPLLQRRGWTVALVKEFLPGKGQEGHQGQHMIDPQGMRSMELCLRLREHFDSSRFKRVEDICDALLHELAHLIELTHGSKHNAVWDQLRNEYERMHPRERRLPKKSC